MVGDIRHYVMNDQETGRFFVNSVISKRALQESDLLAFDIAISIANPGAVMCSYNRINGDFGCENHYTLQDVLKRDWGFKGFVISDWGGTHSMEKASTAGLDQEQPMADFFGFGLSYTTYAYSGLTVDSSARTVRFTVKNTGKRAGTEIAEVYARLPKGADEPYKRLAGWKRATIAPGESQSIRIVFDDRVLRTFDEGKNAWNMAKGKYQVMVGGSSDDTPLLTSLVVR